MFPEPRPPQLAVVDRPAPRERLSRVRALAEVVLCSGYPTQLAIIAALVTLGIQPGANAALSPAFIFAVSGIDTVLLLGMMFAFLRLSNDSPRDVFLGRREALREIALGLTTLPLIFVVVVAAQLGVRALAPQLHNVPVNPFRSLLDSPVLLTGFITVVVLAGGIREELQRAFLLHRFTQQLGGGGLGLVITSVAFGLGHTLQGWDAALVTGLLGAMWGAIYLWRHSALALVVSHAAFNVAQVTVAYAAVSRGLIA